MAKLWNKCPGCGETTKGWDDFCPNCGVPLATKCPECGNEWRYYIDYEFCPKCGAKIKSDESSREGVIVEKGLRQKVEEY